MSAEERYRAALEKHGIEDVRPLYRELLLRLKSEDPPAYERAVQRYEEQVAPALEAGERDPVALWVGYGTWLATRLRTGRTVTVDESGRARPTAAGGEPGSLLLFLPEDRSTPTTALAVPTRLSPAQLATLEILCP